MAQAAASLFELYEGNFWAALECLAPPLAADAAAAQLERAAADGAKSASDWDSSGGEEAEGAEEGGGVRSKGAALAQLLAAAAEAVTDGQVEAAAASAHEVEAAPAALHGANETDGPAATGSARGCAAATVAAPAEGCSGERAGPQSAPLSAAAARSPRASPRAVSGGSAGPASPPRPVWRATRRPVPQSPAQEEALARFPAVFAQVRPSRSPTARRAPASPLAPQCLFLSGRPRASLRAAKLGLRAAVHDGSTLAQAHLWKALAVVQLAKREEAEARQAVRAMRGQRAACASPPLRLPACLQFSRARVLYRRLQLPLGEAAAYMGLACVHARQQEPTAAQRHFAKVRSAAPVAVSVAAHARR